MFSKTRLFDHSKNPAIKIMIKPIGPPRLAERPDLALRRAGLGGRGLKNIGVVRLNLALSVSLGPPHHTCQIFYQIRKWKHLNKHISLSLKNIDNILFNPFLQRKKIDQCHLAGRNTTCKI